VLLFVGRWHGYEGCTAQEVVLPVNVAVDLGSEWLLCTNAAGAVSPLVDVGQLVAITDDLETSSSSCLEALRCNGGPSDRLAARDELAIGRPTYSPRLLAALSEAATEANVHLGRGVLAMMTGPNYETPAEVRMLLRTGATVVSMSTVPEARYAVRLGLDVAAISCVTNRAPTYPGAHVTHEEVLVACRRAQGDAAALMEKWMRHDLVARAHGAP